jgi:hypothetical protein
MAVLSMPLTFTNSFWTQDYHRGLQVLYDKLEQVCTRSFVQFYLLRLQYVGYRRE